MSCAKCPCPATCLAWPAFCAWAAEEPPDPVNLAHICRRSAGPAMPGPAILARNLARSLFDWAVSGFAVASDEEQSRRLAICHACPQWVNGRCRLCGCYTSAKVTLKTEKCPEARWRP